MALISFADDDMSRADLSGEFRRIGGGTAVVRTDQQAAGRQPAEQLLQTAALQVTGQQDGLASAAQDGGKAGFIVSQLRGIELTLQKIHVQFGQSQGIAVLQYGCRNLLFLQSRQQTLNLGAVRSKKLVAGKHLPHRHFFQQIRNSVVVIRIGVRQDNGIDHAMSAMP